MKLVDKQFNRLVALQGEVKTLAEKLSSKLTEHIGEEYFLSFDPGDGWLIVCAETSNQAKLSFMGCELSDLLELSPGEAKSKIDGCTFN